VLADEEADALRYAKQWVAERLSAHHKPADGASQLKPRCVCNGFDSKAAGTWIAHVGDGSLVYQRRFEEGAFRKTITHPGGVELYSNVVEASESSAISSGVPPFELATELRRHQADWPVVLKGPTKNEYEEIRVCQVAVAGGETYRRIGTMGAWFETALAQRFEAKWASLPQRDGGG
jgi:hypothetical protein